MVVAIAWIVAPSGIVAIQTHLRGGRRCVATREGRRCEREAATSRGQIGDNLARFRVVGGCPPTTIHPIAMGLVAFCCPGWFGYERLITQRSRVQIPPPQPSLS